MDEKEIGDSRVAFPIIEVYWKAYPWGGKNCGGMSNGYFLMLR